LRQTADKMRNDRITRLEEALATAESIGLDTPRELGSLIAINTYGLNTENIQSGSLLYLRGAQALRAELQQLRQRESEDAYIPELPDILKKIALLKAINLNPEALTTATIDRAAIIPEEPIRPRRMIIILLGLTAGLVLGFICAVIKY